MQNDIAPLLPRFYVQQGNDFALRAFQTTCKINKLVRVCIVVNIGGEPQEDYVRSARCRYAYVLGFASAASGSSR